MNILLPTDFSENSFQAIQYAYHHFDLSKVNLHIIHVVQEPYSNSSFLLRLDEIMMRDAEKDMNALLARIKKEFNSEPEFTIHTGYLKNWVETMAQSMQIALIVMGTKGENNIVSKVIGSVTESIIRTSKVPTLAIPTKLNQAEIKEIVFATNRNEFVNSLFLKDVFSSLKLNDPQINVLTILNNEQKSAHKSVPLDEYQIGVIVRENDSVVDGINDYLAHHRVDILALYHSHNSRLEYLFNQSITKTICANIQVPLLVMPLLG